MRRTWLALSVLLAAAGGWDTPPERSPLGRAIGAAAPLRAPASLDGQWIWTQADREVLASPSLEAGILVATLRAGTDGIELRRGLSPAVPGTASVELVVRLDDSLHALWDRIGEEHVASELDARLARVLADARATGVGVDAVVLDYDTPVRRLAAWARAVAHVSDGALAGVPLWVTSIPSHLEDPEYGARLAGHVRGHVLQLFDTGLACTGNEVSKMKALLRAQPLAFRLGVASYERRKNGARTTMHECWWRSVAELRADRRFAGVWVFPAGREYGSRLALMEASR